jgi:hypothetical protein
MYRVTRVTVLAKILDPPRRAPVYGRYTEGFDTPDLKQAEALLDGLHA